jgi:hypothetical protein
MDYNQDYVLIWSKLDTATVSISCIYIYRIFARVITLGAYCVTERTNGGEKAFIKCSFELSAQTLEFSV